MAASVNPADVRAQMTRTQKARWRKGFPASHTFGESRYTVAREGNEWYAYCNRLGVFFVSTTPQLVFDAIRADMNNNNITGALIHVKTGTVSPVSITLDRDNTILEGEGWQTFLNSTSGNPVVTVTGDGCIVRDLGVRTETGVAHAIVVTGSTSRITNIWVWDSTADAFRVTGVGCVINSCLITAATGTGIYVDGGYLNISENHIASTGGDGVYLGGQTGYNNVIANVIVSCIGDGVDIESSQNVVNDNNISIIGGNFVTIGSSQNTVNGNSCFNATGIGISIAHQDNIVKGNLLNRTYDDAIVIASGRSNNIVAGNRIMAMWNVNGYAILVSPCSGAVIGENLITNVSSGYGIRVIHPASGVVINCNRINKTATSGLWLSGYNHVVTGNWTPRIIDNSFGSMVRSNKNMSGA